MRYDYLFVPIDTNAPGSLNHLARGGLGFRTIVRVVRGVALLATMYRIAETAGKEAISGTEKASAT